MWTVGVVALWAPIRAVPDRAKIPMAASRTRTILPCQIKNASPHLVGAGTHVDPPCHGVPNCSRATTSWVNPGAGCHLLWS